MSAAGVVALVVLFPIGLAALQYACRTGLLYFTVVGEVLGVPDPDTAAPAPRPTRQHRPGEREPAYEQYLFGPARTDLALILARIRSELPADVRSTLARTWSRWWGRGAGSQVVCLVRVYGLLVGALVGAVLVAVVTAVQVLGAVLLAAAGFAVILLLRGVDAALLRVRGIRMSCPHCYRPIGYPAYRCPACGARHRDVRPGRYGLLRRRCHCDQALLPTLLLLGSHRLTAFCPHPGCGVPLADDTGTAAEVLLPIVGGHNAGKTQLMTAMVDAMAGAAARDGTGFEAADRTTGHRLARLQSAVSAGGAPPPTPPGERPRAYSLYLRPDREPKRLVHLFDSAGETFYDSEVLAGLRYLGTSRTFVFVVDPLSIEAVWERLDGAARDRLEPVRARRSPEFVFQQVLDNVERMAVDPRRTRLAVVLTKADLLAANGVALPAGNAAGSAAVGGTAGSPAGSSAGSSAFDAVGSTAADGAGGTVDSAAIEQWLDDAGLDNLVRSIRHSFGAVRFFATASTHPPSGVDDLVRWLLAGSRTPRRGRIGSPGRSGATRLDPAGRPPARPHPAEG